MRLAVLPLSLMLAVSAIGCGRFGFDLQRIGAENDGSKPGPGDGAIATDAGAGREAGAGDAGETDGQVAFLDGSMPLPGQDGGNPVKLDPACSVPVGAAAAPPVHRYSFSGSGTEVLDSIGSSHGAAIGGATLASGSLTLDGADDFVDLPNGLVSGLSATTLMLWVAWGSGPQRQVVFDFGSSNQGEGAAGSTVTTLSVVASQPATGLGVHLKTASLDASASTGSFLTLGTVHQLTLEILPSSGTLRVYLDGAELFSRAISTFSLADIDDVNAWLGRGQDSGDSFFRGTLHELRIYDRELGPCAVLAAFNAGADDVGFARCAQPEQGCAFTRYGTLGAWTCSNQYTWQASAQICAAAGMNLVNVNDSAENSALAQAIPNLSMWTGYNDISEDGTFVWCGSGSTFSAFSGGEPSKVSARDCVRRDAAANTWRAADCQSAAAFACEP